MNDKKYRYFVEGKLYKLFSGPVYFYNKANKRNKVLLWNDIVMFIEATPFKDSYGYSRLSYDFLAQDGKIYTLLQQTDRLKRIL